MAWLAGAVVRGGPTPATPTARQQLVSLLRGVIDDLVNEGDNDGAIVALESLMRLEPEPATPHGGRDA